jgi:hypothetical protein
MNFGIRVNLGQFLQQLLQVLFVGMTIGMMRNGAAAAVCGLGMAMLFQTLVPPSRTSPTRAGALQPSASTASGATWATASVRSDSARRPRWAADSRAPSGSSPSRWPSRVYRWGEDTHPRLNPAH